jgi:hypothetical protein
MAEDAGRELAGVDVLMAVEIPEPAAVTARDGEGERIVIENVRVLPPGITAVAECWARLFGFVARTSVAATAL